MKQSKTRCIRRGKLKRGMDGSVMIGGRVVTFHIFPTSFGK